MTSAAAAASAPLPHAATADTLSFGMVEVGFPFAKHHARMLPVLTTGYDIPTFVCAARQAFGFRDDTTILVRNAATELPLRSGDRIRPGDAVELCVRNSSIPERCAPPQVVTQEALREQQQRVQAAVAAAAAAASTRDGGDTAAMAGRPHHTSTTTTTARGRAWCTYVHSGDEVFAAAAAFTSAQLATMRLSGARSGLAFRCARVHIHAAPARAEALSLALQSMWHAAQRAGISFIAIESDVPDAIYEVLQRDSERSAPATRVEFQQPEHSILRFLRRRCCARARKSQIQE